MKKQIYMRKLLRKIFRKANYYLQNNTFQRRLVATKGRKPGSIILYDRLFLYHHGNAFFDSYYEIFKKKIYQFEAGSKKAVIIDCGANMGLSILYFSKNYPEAEIIAFEPDKTVLPCLEKNIYSQELKNVILHKKAVWIENTALKFYTDNGMGGRIDMEYSGQKPETVEAVRLKNFLSRPIDMLKIDIEGAEYHVLKDCEDRLHHVNHIFIEYHSVIKEEQFLGEILQILKRNNFRYHLGESFSKKKPFVDQILVCERFDLAINIFAYKN